MGPTHGDVPLYSDGQGHVDRGAERDGGHWVQEVDIPCYYRQNYYYFYHPSIILTHSSDSKVETDTRSLTGGSVALAWTGTLVTMYLQRAWSIKIARFLYSF